MKKRIVISNIPTRLPFASTILYTFLLDYYQVSGLWWGVFITIMTFIWIAAIVRILNEKHVDTNNRDL